MVPFNPNYSMILWFLSTCWLHFFLIQPRKALAVFAIRVQCLFMFNSLLTSTPRQSCPLAGWPCHVAWGYSVPDTALCICFCWTLRFLWVCFSRLLQSLWIALPSGVLVTIPALLVSSANLLGVCSASLCRPLIAMLGGIGASIDPWGMPLLTGRQLEFI